ncbi:MAG: flagellar motor switch phosphatase FliY [Eubacteriales bacterium]
MDPMTGNSGNSCVLTDMEIDAIGEIMNISMGAAATAVSSMLDKQVLITTPRVHVRAVEKIDYSALEPAMIVKITYIKGITGSNIMVFRQKDMQYILNTLMGVNEPLQDDFVFDDLSISAACEVMNQMMGASATALSEFLGRRINISIPSAVIMDEENTFEKAIEMEAKDNVVAIFFDLSITDIMTSEFVCVMDCGLAKMIVSQFMQGDSEETAEQDDSDLIDLSSMEGRASEIVLDQTVEGHETSDSVEKTADSASDKQVSESGYDQMSPQANPQVPPHMTPQMQNHQENMPQTPETFSQTMSQGTFGTTKAENAPHDQQVANQSATTAENPQQPNAYVQQPQYGYGYSMQGAPWMQGMPGMMYPNAGQYPYPPQYMPQYAAYPQQYGYPGQQAGVGGSAKDNGDNAVLKEHVNVQNVQFPAFSDSKPVFSAPLSSGNMNLLMNVPLSVSIEIGRTKKKIRDIMEFSQGSIIELEKQAGAPVDIIVNGQLMARGDVVVIDDNFAVRVTEIIGTKDLIGSLDGSANKTEKENR